jgi:hypothetical protein
MKIFWDVTCRDFTLEYVKLPWHNHIWLTVVPCIQNKLVVKDTLLENYFFAFYHRNMQFGNHYTREPYWIDMSEVKCNAVINTHQIYFLNLWYIWYSYWQIELKHYLPNLTNKIILVNVRISKDKENQIQTGQRNLLIRQSNTKA